MPFTPTDFHGRLDTDLWVIEQILLLPSDPVPNVTEKPDGSIEIAIVDTVAMPQMQDAVAEYRRHLLPVVFVVTQKVYAELFRVMLWQNGRDVGERQYDIERVLQPLVASGSVTAWHPFQDAAAFSAGGPGATISSHSARRVIRSSTNATPSRQAVLPLPMTAEPSCFLGPRQRFWLLQRPFSNGPRGCSLTAPSGRRSRNSANRRRS